LIDAGAEYHGYCGDVTRTFPINGSFTKEQREIYEVVLKANLACISRLDQMMKGDHIQSFHNLHAYSVQILQEEVSKLGIPPNLVTLFFAFRLFEKKKKKVLICLLGACNINKVAMRLYPHSVGHFLGLDVHDCSSIPKSQKFAPGMVVTVEPGIYIPAHDLFPKKYHGIGVRIEDDILLTESGIEILSTGAPKLVEDIEAFMAGKKDDSYPFGFQP